MRWVAWATRRSWVTTRMVAPWLRFRSASSARISSPLWLSRLPVGSSASSSAGALARARATATRWRWPPESWPGRALRRSARPTSQQRRCALPALARAGHATLHRHLDVLQRGEGRQQVVELEHEADRPGPEVVHVLEPRQVLACHPDLARGRLIQRAEHVQQRALATAAGPHHGQQLAARHRQVHAIQRADGRLAGAVELGQMIVRISSSVMALRAAYFVWRIPGCVSRQQTDYAIRNTNHATSLSACFLIYLSTWIFTNAVIPQRSAGSRSATSTMTV